MTFSNLQTTANYMRTGNTDVLSGYTCDSELILLFSTVAKLDLKHDLIYELRLDPEDDNSRLDSAIDLNSEWMQKVLAYKQLAYFYQENNDGEGSMSHERWKIYRGLYNESRSRFGTLLVDYDNSVTSGRLRLG